MRLLWSAHAVADLRAASFYIAAENGVAVAVKVYSTIEAKAEQLADFPQSGRAGRVAGTRELVTPGLPYVLVYSVNAESVLILRVLHDARQWPEDVSH